MYLARIEIDCFRIFGHRNSAKQCTMEFRPGLNLLVGPNDAGKTCVVDAIRLLLGTSTPEYFTVAEEDFHVDPTSSERATELCIFGEFRGLTDDEAGAFAEVVTIDKVTHEFYLQLSLTATRAVQLQSSPKQRPVRTELRAGSSSDGGRLDSHARDLLSATYLRPLRDAVAELAAKKGSRLSQVLRAYREIEGQDKSDWVEDGEIEPKTLVGIMRKAESALKGNSVIQSAEKELNTQYLERFSLGSAALEGKISPARFELQNILERLELGLSGGDQRTASRGLGIHNLLFMATELLALGKGGDAELPIVLIEEPEAHLEPQRQLRLVEYLLERAKTHVTSSADQLQLILTSHSPNLASRIPLRHITLVHAGRAFSLAPGKTRLDPSDYEFLERFLDVTKANILFARGILIVEGDAEALLLPTLAEILKRPLSKSGVSIVNVGHTGLFRYARILQRSTQGEGNIPIPVACIADRDIPPSKARELNLTLQKAEDEYDANALAEHIKGLKTTEGGSVKVFVSGNWTFEFDLVLSGLGEFVHIAACLAKTRASKPFVGKTIRAARKQFKAWQDEGKSGVELACNVYAPFLGKAGTKPSKAETAQWLARLLRRKWIQEKVRKEQLIPAYLVQAIEHATEELE
jgi:putative ATP-dependent endonuclease of OLD family